ncbi:MAG TPA: TonB-dependent receptor [Terriglobia bacterium]|nr:TonB-dependent receptor [Terriglobia bacterium]
MIKGRVVDPVGAAVPGAKVVLFRLQKASGQTHTNEQGFYQFTTTVAGRYHVHVEAEGFNNQDSPSVFGSKDATANVKVLLQIGPLRQQVVVSDSGSKLPASQVGASISLIDRQELDALGKLSLADVLRLMPGVQVVQTGQRGGTTSVFVRGGDADFNKVLIDGIPANDIGGAFEFADASTSGIDSLEVLRGPNSALYGSDALSSVMNITTRKGTTPVPQLTYSVDGGNFNTLHQAVSLGGVYRQFDYFSDFSRFDTQNGLPNSSFHNGTYSGNFGWEPGKSSSVRFTVRHDTTGLGDPNALNLYGIPDTSFQRDQDTYLGITAQNQTTSRWHNLLRLTSTNIQYHFDDPSPAGVPFNPSGFGANYLGDPVTICGANGYCAHGQAILDYGGVYPQLFNSDTTVRSVYAQSNYALNPALGVTAGFEYDNETGFTQSSGEPKSASVRNNYNGFLEVHSSLGRRLFATAGVGLDSNAIFGFAATPRVSAAYYLRQPAAGAAWGHTKLRFNFGKGIEEPSIFDQGASLYSLLSATSEGTALIQQYGISPVGAERSSTLDFGIEQGLWNERMRAEITFFHDRFSNLLDYVPQSALPQLGVPAPVVALAPEGATINSDSFRSMGAEAGVDLSLSQNWILKVNYTYLDTVVTQSFASSALFPATNPAFPNIPIGAFAPLVGGRPFRRPRHTGSVLFGYSRRRYGLNLTGYFVSRSDDSTYLTDANFGNTLLLPNHNLLMGYQLIDFSGWYNVRPGVELYTSMGNLLNQRYMAAFGYPALPYTFRAGVKFTLGNEGLKW